MLILAFGSPSNIEPRENEEMAPTSMNCKAIKVKY